MELCSCCVSHRLPGEQSGSLFVQHIWWTHCEPSWQGDEEEERPVNVCLTQMEDALILPWSTWSKAIMHLRSFFQDRFHSTHWARQNISFVQDEACGSKMLPLRCCCCCFVSRCDTSWWCVQVSCSLDERLLKANGGWKAPVAETMSHEIVCVIAALTVVYRKPGTLRGGDTDNGRCGKRGRWGRRTEDSATRIVLCASCYPPCSHSQYAADMAAWSGAFARKTRNVFLWL